MTSYIGKAPEFSPFPKQLFDGDNSTTDFVLNFNPGSPNALLVFELVGGEYKWREPTTDFTMLTATTLRFGTPPATGTNNIVVMFLGVRSNSLAVGPNSVSRSNLDGDLQTKTDDVANKSNKIVPGATGNVSSLAADGDLQDAGFLASKVQQQISGGTNGNIVSRDVNGDIQDAGFLSSEVVTESGSQTLTNKDLSDSSIVFAPRRGVLISPFGGNQSVSSATDTAVIYGTAWYDTNSFFSGGAPDRLTIPAGVTKIRVTARVGWFSSWSTGGSQSADLRKNSSNTFPGSVREIYAPSTLGISMQNVYLTTGVIQCVANDIFQVFVSHDSGSSETLFGGTDGVNTWISIEVIE